MFDADRVSLLTFDSYSTIVDVGSTVEALAPHVDDPEYVAAQWRAHSLMYSMAANDVDAYEPFYELNRHALTYALEAAGAEVTDAERDEILSVYMDLYVFGDVAEGVARLSEGYDLWVVSNGNPEMLDRMFEVAGLHDYVEGYVSADEVETFKPAAELYRHGAARTGTPIDEVVHATAGWFDVLGARHAGMQAAWVDRKGTPWEPFGGDPDATVETLHGLADLLGA